MIPLLRHMGNTVSAQVFNRLLPAGPVPLKCIAACAETK